MAQEMLSIDKIYKRLEINPEPKDVTDTRNRIIDSFKDLVFVEDGHKYFAPDNNGNTMELQSVSAVCQKFEQHVDWDSILVSKSEKMGITPKELERQWHETNIISTHCGSKTHFFGENAMNMFIGKEDLAKKQMTFQYSEDGYLIPYCPKEWAVTKYYLDILNNPNVYPVMPEARIYTGINDMLNLKTNYAGTFDILMAYNINGKIKYSIHDFKTNKELYKSYARTYNKMMLSPFDEMGFYDEPYHHYVVQLNCYQLGLRQIGVEVVDRNIIYLKEDGSYEKIKVPDITDTLLKVL